MNKRSNYAKTLILSMLAFFPMTGCMLTTDGLGDVLGQGDDPNNPGAQMPGQVPGQPGQPGSGGVDENGQPLPPPDPQNPCGLGGDIFEPNNSLERPSALTESAALAGIFAGVSATDTDVFGLTVEKSDPRSLTLDYEVPTMDGAELSMRVFDSAGEVVAEHDEVRTDLSESMLLSWMPNASENYRVAVVSDLTTCTPYKLKLAATTCTDEYEDNDNPSQAKPLSLGYSLEPLATNLTIHPKDPDFFTLTVPTKDPALVVAKHPGLDADVALEIEIRDPDGNLVGDARREEGEKFTELLTNWVPEVGGETYQIEVRSLLGEDACNSYDLAIQRCTDSFEDNDRADQAAALPKGEHNATISDLDKDYYKIENDGLGGSCTVTYKATSGEDMSMFLFADNKLDPISEHHEDRLEETEVMTVSWTSDQKGELILWINAADKRCTDYTISCVSNGDADAGKAKDPAEGAADGDTAGEAPGSDGAAPEGAGDDNAQG